MNKIDWDYSYWQIWTLSVSWIRSVPFNSLHCFTSIFINLISESSLLPNFPFLPGSVWSWEWLCILILKQEGLLIPPWMNFMVSHSNNSVHCLLSSSREYISNVLKPLVSSLLSATFFNTTVIFYGVCQLQKKADWTFKKILRFE